MNRRSFFGAALGAAFGDEAGPAPRVFKLRELHELSQQLLADGWENYIVWDVTYPNRSGIKLLGNRGWPS